jgi:hypothetical protein
MSVAKSTSELLNFIDIAQLRAIAAHYECECNLHSKLDLIKHVHTVLHRREPFLTQVQTMTVAHIRFLQLLLFDVRESYALQDVLVRARFACFDCQDDALLRQIIVDFQTRGWLFGLRQAGGHCTYTVADDLSLRYAGWLGEWMRASLPACEEPHVYRHERGLLLADVKLLLRFTGQAGLELTQAGTIQKRILQQFMLQCNKPESLQLQGWRFGYGQSTREYPDRFSLIHDFCQAQGWLLEEEARLMLSESGMYAAERLDEGDLHALFRYWLRSYRRAIPNIAALVRMTVGLCSRWTDVRALTQELERFVKPYYYDEPAQVLELRMLPMMIAFGLLRVAEVGGCTLICATEDCAALLGPFASAARSAAERKNTDSPEKTVVNASSI